MTLLDWRNLTSLQAFHVYRFSFYPIPDLIKKDTSVIPRLESILGKRFLYWDTKEGLTYRFYFMPLQTISL